jgi:hypothetical protein
MTRNVKVNEFPSSYTINGVIDTGNTCENNSKIDFIPYA